MALTNAFKEAVNSGNVRRIRIMMKDSLLVDPTFREFKEMENAAASVQGLYDIHDKKEFELNKENWDDNYMNKQMVQLVSNFSHKRIEHIKDVVRYLRPEVKTTQSSIETRRNNSTNTITNTSKSYKEQKRRDQRKGDFLGSTVATGAVAGAVAGAVVASATASMTIAGAVATGAVAGGVVGGVAVSIVSKRGR